MARVRHCYGEKPVVIEITAATFSEVFAELGEVLKSHEHEGRYPLSVTTHFSEDKVKDYCVLVVVLS